ncbi:MAG: class I SAM-dependent methyltransferase [Gammaproteobacteria bacterium]|nr:class I SAM-dependent methyltransferase [Gammaproteobacteria bacterium]
MTKDFYDSRRAAAYVAHHEKSSRTRTTTLRERALLRKCLLLNRQTGENTGESVVDVACGAGRFWPTLAQFSREIVALDLSPALLRASTGPEAIACHRVCGSTFALPFADNVFDTLVCLRFMHHLGRAADRIAVLQEFHRVSRQRAIVSLWTDGSFAASRRLKRQRESPPPPAGFDKRRCTPRSELLADFHAAGWRVEARYAVWPGLSMWHFFSLKKVAGDV